MPCLAVNAVDDPIMHCDSLHAEEYSRENENLLFLVTERGGHAGWPWGWRFRSRGWDFMGESAKVFIYSLLGSASSLG